MLAPLCSPRCLRSTLEEANGTAERDAGLVMLEQIPGTSRVTVGADKAYGTADFVAECRHMQVTPYVAQNQKRPGGSAINARTTRHAGYQISQQKRKRIEESFGWLKTIALLRKVRRFADIGAGGYPPTLMQITRLERWCRCYRMARNRRETAAS